ncbi:PepSY domain-containing protein [Methylocaldum szegediense]|jgi:uncharacterized iron-regulated membrane protein|uniref:PepSY domain-containing protein n=1 Tax=Methylocaldum szegediense TaxID=73780 RepID=UPI0003FE4830|nr:PepSY domain-containing protein [Methylocaldum szegediense]
MSRRVWVLIHRYAGLAMAGFLILVGLTGSLLAFLSELNRAFAPHLFPTIQSARTMGLGELALAAQALLPNADVTRVYLIPFGIRVNINFMVG